MNEYKEPAITLTKDDHKTLSLLAEHRQHDDIEAFLLNEISRARVVPVDQHDPSIVRIGAKVRFRDLATGVERDIVLVLPNDADISKGKVSVLTAVGVALIGLSEGQSISFTAPDGKSRTLSVAKVIAPTVSKRRRATLAEKREAAVVCA